MNDYAELLDCTEELIEGDFTFVVDVEELEGAGHESLLAHGLRAALGYFLSEIGLEAIYCGKIALTL